MTATLPGLAPPMSLRLNGPVFGIDTSTLRMSACGLLPVPDKLTPDVKWSTLSLAKTPHLAWRQALAYEAMVPWLQELEERWGTPAVIGYEQPLAGGNTPLPSFFVVGALLVAVGQVFGVETELLPFSPGEWKKLATGHGYCPGLPKGMPKAQKRTAEKARLVEWAREAAGYPGQLDDEADATGVATATGIRVELRTRAAA